MANVHDSVHTTLSQQDTQLFPFYQITRLLKHARPIRSAKGGYSAQCPAHNDSSNSLAVWEDETDQHVGLKCYAGCSRSAICSAWNIEETDLYVKNGTRAKSKASPKPTLFNFAADKMLHPHFLANQGLLEDKAGICITYYRPDGTEYTRHRIRTNLVAKKGSTWSNGTDDIIPYGLHCLEEARLVKRLVICEGETDCLTLRWHNIPAIGVPGATLTHTIQAAYLTDIKKVYIIQEPDNAGSKFASDVRKRLIEIGYKGQIHTLNFQKLTGAKDPNELHKRDVKAFSEAFKAAMTSVEPARPKIQRLVDLQQTVLPETKWAIDPLLPEGVTILGGKPKLGKSWLALSMQLAISSGGAALGQYPVERGEVLYISLEDNDKRLQKRSNQLLRNALASPDFYYATEWPRLNEGGQEMIEEYITEHPRLKLIVIDPWARIKPKTNPRQNQQYDDDYEAITPLQKLAGEKGVSILVIDHMRKTESEDPLDMIAGSVGKTGAVDGFLLLYRKRGESDARLFVTGRDIEEEQELLLSFNQEASMWTVKGESDDNTIASTPQQQDILDTLARAENGLTVKVLAEKLKKNINTTRNLLQKLRNGGKVVLQNNIYSIVTIVNRSKDSNHSNHSNLPDSANKEVTTDTTEHSNHSNHHSNPVSSDEKLTQDTFEDEVTTVTMDTTQKPDSSLPKKLPKWLTPGTFEWDKLVERVGFKEANERRQAALREAGADE